MIIFNYLPFLASPSSKEKNPDIFPIFQIVIIIKVVLIDIDLLIRGELQLSSLFNRDFSIGADNDRIAPF